MKTLLNILRKHWFDIGVLPAIIAIMYIAMQYHFLSGTSLLLWINFAALFLHQLEEYRYPGYFPGMVNAVMYKSSQPDRYPLNTQTSLIVNVLLGWGVYLLAAVYADTYMWIGIAAILVSAGNFIAHTLLFNIKGHTLYNPGMLTAVLLFFSLVVYYFATLVSHDLATMTDWIAGMLVGIVLNVVGILKMIDWLADKNTRYVFENRQLRPKDRVR